MTVYATTNQPTVAKSSGFVQIPVELITYVRSLNLTGTQYDLWLYLFSLDPYGDRFIVVPPPKEIATILQVDYRTVERLADCHLFEFQIEQWKARNRKPLLKTVLPVEQLAAAPSVEPLPSQDSKSSTQISLGKEIRVCLANAKKTSNCLGCQGVTGTDYPSAPDCQRVLCLTIALRMINNLCIQAVKATFAIFPAFLNRS